MFEKSTMSPIVIINEFLKSQEKKLHLTFFAHIQTYLLKNNNLVMIL